MKKPLVKLQQLQIRVSPEQKAAIQAAARRANIGMSEWVLSQVLSMTKLRFGSLVTQLRNASEKSYVVAELHDLLNDATPKEFERMVAEPFKEQLSDYWQNYLAAMIEYAANQKGIRAPQWLFEIKPLTKPVFGTELLSLRLHLLIHSPPPFRRRNIFIDSTIGERV